MEQRMVGRVGVEPTVSFRRRIMSPDVNSIESIGYEKKRSANWL